MRGACVQSVGRAWSSNRRPVAGFSPASGARAFHAAVALSHICSSLGLRAGSMGIVRTAFAGTADSETRRHPASRAGSSNAASETACQSSLLRRLASVRCSASQWRRSRRRYSAHAPRLDDRFQVADCDREVSLDQPCGGAHFGLVDARLHRCVARCLVLGDLTLALYRLSASQR